MDIKFKKLSEKAITPTRAYYGDAGLDLYAVSEELTLGYVEYKTDLAFEIPHGYVGLLFPRSSVSSQTNLILANCVGVLDSGYRGNVSFRFRVTTQTNPKRYKTGDKIGQLIILPFPSIELVETEVLSDSQRDTKGYGSSSGKV